MTISVQRLTLYAIFEALEKDLRSILFSEIVSYQELTQLLNENELTKITNRYKRAEESPTIDEEDPERLIQYLDLLDTVQIINRNKTKLPAPLARYFSSITPILEKCAPVRNAVMHGRPLEIDDFPTVCAIANKLTNDNNYNWSHMSSTLSQIENDSSYIFGLDFSVIDESPSGAFHNLPTPDFDDTGFVGRRNVLGKVEDAISGPFPVISLVGPGGVGKTALALKAAYELLAKESIEFEAIVWVSAKANTLTATEIKRIEGAIENSLGVFSSIVSEFEENSEHEPEGRLIDLLSSFEVLLIIDNVETVLDDRLRRFIQKVPKGSKIVLTSRIGIGSGDLSIEIPALTMAESRTYFRKLVQSYDVERLKSTNAEMLDYYIKRLISNPLFLKWFVTAVKAGSSPERLLSDQTEILKFCLENVIEHLDSNAKLICNVYLVVDGPHSLAMLVRLTELQPRIVETALAKLLSFNIITMISINGSGDTSYQMSDLLRAYLRRIDKLSSEAANRITRRHGALLQTIEQVGYYRGEQIYRFENFQISNRDEAIVVAELKKAFALIRKKQFEDALRTLEPLSIIAPGYFEVERVKAYLRFEMGDFVSAKHAYELALELKSDYAPLYFWYGGFLLRAYNDLDGALKCFEKALQLQYSLLVEREKARVMVYKGMFQEAEQIIDGMLEGNSLSNRQTAIVTDLKIRCLCANFEHQIDTGELDRAIELLGLIRKHGESIPDGLYDEKMSQKYRWILPKIEGLALRLQESNQGEAARELLVWASDFADRDIPIGRIGRINPGVRNSSVLIGEGGYQQQNSNYIEGQSDDGIVVRIAESRRFGFIRTKNGEDLFFHQSSVSSRGQCLYMGVGVAVEFKIGVNPKGYCATDVRLKFSNDPTDLLDGQKRVEARVVFRREGTDYGFAIIPEYGEVLLRREDFGAPEEWLSLREGDVVEFLMARAQRGFLGKEIRALRNS